MKKFLIVFSVVIVVVGLVLIFTIPAKKANGKTEFFPTIAMGEFVESIPAEISRTWHIATVKIDEKEIQFLIPVSMLESWVPGDSIFILRDNTVKYVDFIIPREKAEELIVQGKARY